MIYHGGSAMFRVCLSARDIMTSPVITVNENMAVEELSDLFADRMISGAPVVNDSRALVGVVTQNDIVMSERRRKYIVADGAATDDVLKAWAPQFGSEEMTGYHVEESGAVTVKEIMTPVVFRVDEDTLAQDVAKTMVSARIHRLFVSRDDKIIGVISALDMLRCSVRAIA